MSIANPCTNLVKSRYWGGGGDSLRFIVYVNHEPGKRAEIRNIGTFVLRLIYTSGKLVTWHSQKVRVVSHSCVEVKYCVMAETTF